MILSYVYITLAGVLHTLNKSYLDIKDIGATYLTYFVFLISCYLLKNYFSSKFLNFIRIIKSSIVLICLISLKYLDLNLTLSINFFLFIQHFTVKKNCKKILSNKKKLEENECILKEKEIIDEIERKKRRGRNYENEK
nr:stearoyl-CoA desaturase, putative [Plasmodium sp. DRC-Itaito]